MTSETTWATTAEACHSLRIGRTALLAMRDRGELVIGRHWYRPAANRLLWNPEAIRETQITRTTAVRRSKPVETYDLAGVEA
jgi:hypothetical protein